MSGSDGMTYDPKGGDKPVVKPGEFVFAAACLDHAHINGMVGSLIRAGGELRYVYEPDAAKRDAFVKAFPTAKPVDSIDRILDDSAVHCVAGAAVPNQRCALGLKVMDAGKDYFTDKSPFTTLEQLESARTKVEQTGRKYMVYYSERLHNAPTYQACELARSGAIGRVLQVLVTAPHRLSKPMRPQWFFQKEAVGGILTDIGSHQFEQLLYATGASDASLNFARVENFQNSDTPELEDYGEASLTLEGGASGYCRMDWFTPDAARAWGDGRLFILGSEGYIEARKYLDVGNEAGGPVIHYVNHKEERSIDLSGTQAYPFFGELVLDILNRTEKAMTQEHAFKAAELSMKAQALADQARP